MSVGARIRFDQDDIRCRRAAVSLDAAAMPPIWIFTWALAKTPVFAGGLDGGGDFDRLAEGLHRYARRRRNMCVGCGIGGGRRRSIAATAAC